MRLVGDLSELKLNVSGLKGLQIVHVFNGEGDTTLTATVGRPKKRTDRSKM